MSSTGKGTGMHMDRSYIRFGRKTRRGPVACLDDSIVEIRRLLRTDMSIPAIAEAVHVSPPTLRNFIKRRQLCSNMRERRNSISLQQSLVTLDNKATKRPHSSDVEQPHCRRTRADSSPAAGTNSQSVRDATPGGSAAMAKTLWQETVAADILQEVA